MENETIGELVLAIDTSASIGEKELAEFGSEIVSICDTVTPEKIRVLWWDYEVAKEQVFNKGDYQQIRDLLKPDGGGGTRVSCVSKYLVEHNIKPEAIIVFTDGYVESEDEISWDIPTPTLWVVTQNKERDFTSRPGHAAVSWDNV